MTIKPPKRCVTCGNTTSEGYHVGGRYYCDDDAWGVEEEADHG